ncbi:MAG: A/G-specific adenine glycosylase [Acidimicrobiia bacterium]
MTLVAAQAERNESLLTWFKANSRDLPWRRSTDPYPVLLSEVMLQQTQVSRVLPKFEAFMEHWPTIESLAAARTDELLRVWSGLGYNSRALRLQDAARWITRSGWPDTLAGLCELPGVGPYTAAAVGAISFGIDVPAVDTNLTRILSRWAGEPLSGAMLSEYAYEVVGTPAGDWNQALMDLGSAVCIRQAPMCSVCPVSKWCGDPTVYEPPPRQSRFEGSHRQLRGALLHAHLNGTDLHDIGRALNRSDTEIALALSALEDEGLIDVVLRDK